MTLPTDVIVIKIPILVRLMEIQRLKLQHKKEKNKDQSGLL